MQSVSSFVYARQLLEYIKACIKTSQSSSSGRYKNQIWNRAHHMRWWGVRGALGAVFASFLIIHRLPTCPSYVNTKLTHNFLLSTKCWWLDCSAIWFSSFVFLETTKLFSGLGGDCITSNTRGYFTLQLAADEAKLILPLFMTLYIFYKLINVFWK